MRYSNNLESRPLLGASYDLPAGTIAIARYLYSERPPLDGLE